MTNVVYIVYAVRIILSSDIVFRSIRWKSSLHQNFEGPRYIILYADFDPILFLHQNKPYHFLLCLPQAVLWPSVDNDNWKLLTRNWSSSLVFVEISHFFANISLYIYVLQSSSLFFHHPSLTYILFFYNRFFSFEMFSLSSLAVENIEINNSVRLFCILQRKKCVLELTRLPLAKILILVYVLYILAKPRGNLIVAVLKTPHGTEIR